MQGSFSIKLTDAVECLVSIVAYVVVTLGTIAGTESQVVQPLGSRLHELLVDDAPRTTE